MYKQLSTIVQVSGLYGLQFLSCLPKRFTRLCRALYGDAMHICVQFWYTNMAARNQQNHLEFTFSIKALSFHSRASISAHKHIFYYEKRLNCWKSGGETFFQRDSIPSLVARTVKTRKSNCFIFEMKHATGLKTCTKIYFLFIFIPKPSLFWFYNLMTSPWNIG